MAHNYGMITDLDAEVLDATLKLAMADFPEGDINTVEVGVFDGNSSRGIYNFVSSNGRTCHHTAIDNEKDKKVLLPFLGCNMIVGDSLTIYERLEEKSQHFIFLDGNHCLRHVIAEFFCFGSRLKVGGYLCLHDSGKHIQPFKDYQGRGSKTNPDNYISVRKALTITGLIDEHHDKWKLIFDEYDENDEAGGTITFKKVL